MIETDLGELDLMYPNDHVAPELGDIEHVGLVDVGDLSPSELSAIEGYPCNPLDLMAFVHHRREPLVRSVVRWLAEVDPAGQLPDDQEVGASRQLLAERRKVLEAGEDCDGTEVGEYSQQPPQLQDPGLDALLSRQSVPGVVAHRAASRAHQDSVCLEHRRLRLLGKGISVRLGGGSTERKSLHIEREVEAGAHGVQDLEG